MPQTLSEYLVSYAVKEWLITAEWDILAYNPPGSQGTFTIPNPNKDPNYRGQTGSESPDIVATKNGVILVAEAKPNYSSSDATKIERLFEDPLKMEIFQLIIRRVAEANHISLPAKLRFIGFLANADDEIPSHNLGHFKVSTSMPLEMSNIPAQQDYRSHFVTTAHLAADWGEKIKSLFEK